MQLFYQNLERLSDVAKVHAQESLSFFLELHLTHTQSDKCHPQTCGFRINTSNNQFGHGLTQH